MSAQPQTIVPQQESKPQYSTFYIWYVVGVLMVAYIFSFIDRQIFSMVVGPLRRDLHITDTQVSYLQGLSFVIFYTFFGILIGRLVDTYSRRTIIAVGMVLWSLFTTGCGMATGYWQMLGLRMGVGVGEAALSPAAYSLVTDYVPPRRLSTAIGLYGAGIYVGSGLSFLLGGLVRGYAAGKTSLSLPIVGQIHSWQILFFVVGLPGILLAPLLYTIREPRTHASGVHLHPSVPIGQVFGYIFTNCKTFLLHNIGFGLLSLASMCARITGTSGRWDWFMGRW
jgi:MFS family permease